MAKIKVPKHGGPDGQGLDLEVFERLVDVLEDPYSTPADQQAAINFCFSASKQLEWNETYKPQIDSIVKGLE